MDINNLFKLLYGNGFLNLEIIFSENYIEEINFIGKKNINHADEKRVLGFKNLPHVKYLLGLLDLYFSEKEAPFDISAKFERIPVNFNGYSNFTAKILKTLRSTAEYGETTSYKNLALAAGLDKKYSRACAGALSKNKTPLLIPCHRVIMDSGKLGGYSGGGGVSLKAKLLSMEKRNSSQSRIS